MQKNKLETAKQSLSEFAYCAIEEMIVKQELAPGNMISEAELCKELDCGRTPIREAFLRLKLEGYIDIHARRGAIVTGIDLIRQLELLEVRRPLEVIVANLAARRATDEERDRCKTLAELILKTADEGDKLGFYETIKSIHDLLENATHNQVLSKTMSGIHAHSRRFWYAYTGPDQLTSAAKFQAKILDNISQGNSASAENAAIELIDHIEKRTRQALERRI